MDPSLRFGISEENFRRKSEEKSEGPQLLSKLRATSDAEPISRIL
jgi:hypothetical protein